jgi:hypothetical protein
VLATLLEIRPIAWAVIDPQFGNVSANRFHVAGIALPQAADAYQDASFDLPIAKIGEPSGEDIAFDDLDHYSSVPDWARIVNCGSQ